MLREIPREDRVLSAINDAHEQLIPAPGSIIAERYRILECIGEGGMGKVYEAEDTRLGRRVAIKFLRAALSADRTATERLLREARAASSIEHDNIVSVSDLGHLPSGSAYYVMEILRGESLAETLHHHGRLPWSRVAGIALQLCDALNAAHARGIVHRDLKPENIFRTPRAWNQDFIKILDFGIAGIAQAGSDPQGRLTRTDDFLGTVSYMSPEQASGDMTAHPRIDVYATGVLLYHLLTGILPFRGENTLQVLRAILNAHASAMHIVAPDANISPEIEALVARAMHPDPGLRFPDIASLGAAVLALAPTTGAPPPLPQVPAASTRPRPDLSLAHRPTELAATDAIPALGIAAAEPGSPNDALTKPAEEAPDAPAQPGASPPTETHPGPATTVSQPRPGAATPPTAGETPNFPDQQTLTAASSTASDPETTPPTSPALSIAQTGQTSASPANTSHRTPAPGRASAHLRRRWWLLGGFLVVLIAGGVLTWQALDPAEAPGGLPDESPSPSIITPEKPVSPTPNKDTPTKSPPRQSEPPLIDKGSQEGTETPDIKKTTAPTEVKNDTPSLTAKKINLQVQKLARDTCAAHESSNVSVRVTVKKGKRTIDSLVPVSTLGTGARNCLKGLTGKDLKGIAMNDFKDISVVLWSDP